MDLCVQTWPFEGDLRDTFSYVADLGVTLVDVNTSTFYSPADIDPAGHLADESKVARLADWLAETGVDLDVLACTTNPLHPDPERRTQAQQELHDTISLAAKLDVRAVTTFAGLPGGAQTDTTPNWVTAMVPPAGQSEIIGYQWDEVALPFWREMAAHADRCGVDIGIEIHLNTLVNNAPQLLKLRDQTGDRIGAYIDPAHQVIQGIDPSSTIRHLDAHDAITHIEFSDVTFDEENKALKGVLDTTPYPHFDERAWHFCAIGDGQPRQTWMEIVEAIDGTEYAGSIGIQLLATPGQLKDNLERSIDFIESIQPGG